MLAATPVPPALLLRGTIVGGHFRIERWLGAGGMGVVHLARDTELERDVALKVHLDPSRPDAVERLAHEARAMAKLAHPNVLVVHEVGTFEDRLWVAMEYVDGGTAGEWLAERPRRWTEILDMYCAAAEGLAAAHEVGIVHRDFKPDNVLIGRDGRVRVADFGLARSFTQHDITATQPLHDTRVSEVAGTPAYMAPEQFRPGNVGPAADQWALCVALWQALHGAPPYGDRPTWSLTPDDRPLQPTRTNGPAWLRRVLHKGVAVEPADRHPDLRALLDVIARLRTRRSRWRRGSLLAASALVAGWMGLAFGIRSSSDPCAKDDPRTAHTWSEARRERIAAAFQRVGPLGPQTWARTAPRIDEYVSSWQDEVRHACRSLPSDARASASTCFDQALARVDGLLRAWEQATLGLVEHAFTHLDTLDDPQLCSVSRVHVASFDPRARTEVAEVRAELDALSLRLSDGPIEDAESTIHHALALADTWADDTLRAQAFATRAGLRLVEGRPAAAADECREAFWAARRVDHASTAVQAASQLAWLLALELGRVEQGLEWSRHARVEVERGRVAAHHDARLDMLEGLIHGRLGRYEESLAFLRAALDKQRRHGSTVERARAEAALADALDRAGRSSEAIPHFESALAVLRQAVGPAHPDVANMLTNMGLALGALGRFDHASAAHAESISILERIFGRTHMNLAGPQLNLGIALGAADRLDEAVDALERALEITKETRPDDHEDMALILAASGWLEERRGHYAAALQHFEQALEYNREALPSNHPELAVNLAQIGGALQGLGDAPRAREQFVASIDHWRTTGPDHPRSAVAWIGLAEIELELGRSAEARTAAERVLELATQGDVEEELTTRARALLVRLPDGNLSK